MNAPTSSALVQRTSTLQEAYAPGIGHNVKIGGRKLPVAVGPHFRFAKYLGLPQAPDACDYTGGVSTSAALANIAGNDTLGDCVIAAFFHLLALWTGNASGIAFNPTPAQWIAMYSAIGGYVPGDPNSDQGCDMTTALNWIVQHGFPNGDKPLGWVRIDATNVAEVMAAIWLFEGCDFGVGLPQAYVDGIGSMTNGYVWDVAGPAVVNNGHSFMGAGYDKAKGIKIDTWGMLGWFTWSAIAQYAIAANGGEIDIILSADMVAKGMQKAPNGVDWAALVADFDQIGGAVPIPQPVPGPAPAPTSKSVTLAQMQGWAASSIGTGRPLMTRGQAAALANAGLAKGFGSAS